MAIKTLISGTSAIKGCKIIYSPKGLAGEYAKLATNPYRNCGHKCLYCYVPAVLHIQRQDFDSGAIPRDNFIERLKIDAIKYQKLGIQEQVLLSFTSDPYHPYNNALTREVIIELQNHGLGVCTLTKGGSRALIDLDLFRPGRDAFATTLTSLSDVDSKKWERNAALPGDRIDTIKRFHDAGIFTWVSLEPVLDPQITLDIIQNTYTFVDLYKIGKANYLPISKSIDWRKFTNQAVSMFNRLKVKHYFKLDLQQYLPPNYYNPGHIQQHH